MAGYNKFNQYQEDLHHKVHNFSSDQLMIALSVVVPISTNAVLGDITQISYSNCSPRSVTKTSSGQTSGIYKLVLEDLVITASGGAIAPFRYVILYNDTPSSPGDPLISWYDYGSAVNVLDGETFTVDFSESNGAFTSS